MARSSLSKSSRKLNLSRHQLALFHEILGAGNQMATALSLIDVQPLSPQEHAMLVRTWSTLLMKLADMLL